MILHIKSNDPQISILDNSPKTWRQNWSSEHLDSMMIAVKDDEPIGRVGIYLNPSFKDQGIAFLGAFEVIYDYTVTEALLSKAIAYLKNKGFNQVIGPIDGSTWNNYRFREGGANRPFFLEPVQAGWYPEHWRKFGFFECQKYQSHRMPLKFAQTDFIQKDLEQFPDNSIQLRNFDPNHAERDLKLLADFNMEAFRKSFLYSPSDKEKFVKKYQALVQYFDPELIFLAEDKEGLAGFIFAIPDHLDKSGENAIVKTLARKSGKKYTGLGRLLSHQLIQKAKDKGYEYLIHALMRANNASIALSERLGGKLYSEYGLFRLG